MGVTVIAQVAIPIVAFCMALIALWTTASKRSTSIEGRLSTLESDVRHVDKCLHRIEAQSKERFDAIDGRLDRIEQLIRHGNDSATQ